MQHAGSAVVFSGTTVGISLLALLAVPIPALRSIGIAGLLIALVSVAVGVTLLPVVLATVGPKVDGRATSVTLDRAVDGLPGHGLSCATAGLPLQSPPSSVRSLLLRRRFSSGTRAQAHSRSRAGPHRLDNLNDSGIGSGPLSPFDALVKRETPPRSPRPPRRSRASSGSRARGLASRRNRSRHRHSDRGRELTGRPRDARPAPRGGSRW